jgi:hypothetical protein
MPTGQTSNHSYQAFQTLPTRNLQLSTKRKSGSEWVWTLMLSALPPPLLPPMDHLHGQKHLPTPAPNQIHQDTGRRKLTEIPLRVESSRQTTYLTRLDGMLSILTGVVLGMEGGAPRLELAFGGATMIQGKSREFTFGYLLNGERQTGICLNDVLVNRRIIARNSSSVSQIISLYPIPLL